MRTIAILSVFLTFLWSLVARADGVLFVDKYPYESGVKIRTFATLKNASGQTTLTDNKGRTETIESKFIVGIVTFLDEREFPNIIEEAALAPLLSKKSDTESTSAKLVEAKPYAHKTVATIDAVIARFRSGERKLNGKWFTAAEYQKYLLDLAAENAAIQATTEKRLVEQKAAAELRIADQAATEKLRATEQAAIENRKQADNRNTGETSEKPLTNPLARDEAVIQFKERVNQLLPKALQELAAIKIIAVLGDVNPLSPNLTTEVVEMADSARSFRRSVGYDVALRECAEETATVDTLTVIEKVFREVKSMDPSSALEDMAAFARNYPAPPSQGLQPAYKILVNLQTLCLRLKSESQVHIGLGKAFAVTKKMAEAIKEYEQAEQIFPSYNTASMIREAREQSLGL